MKLERLFEGKNNILYKTDGTEFKIAPDGVKGESLSLKDGTSESALCIFISWSALGLDDESYNEDFLAKLRDVLKEFEEASKFAIIVPLCDSECSSSSQKENLTASFKHCARRIKDCKSVIGFAIPKEADSDFFIEELKAKHDHYVFFSSDEKVLKDGSIVKLALN